MAVDRVAIFIDAGYLEKVLLKEFAGAAVDYGKLATDLAAGKDVLRTYYYNCPPYQSNPATPEEADRKAKADKFYAALSKLPRFEVRLGRLAKRSCSKCGATHFQQKRADLMLGVDLVNLSAREQISTAILIAGDSDLLPAVLLAKGKRSGGRADNLTYAALVAAIGRRDCGRSPRSDASMLLVT